MVETKGVEKMLDLGSFENDELIVKEVGANDSLQCKILGCKRKPLITDHVTGEIICGCCGSILVERSPDLSPEKINSFEDFLTKTRTGPEQYLSMYDMGMMTVISDKDASGKYLSRGVRNTFGRLKVLNMRSRISSSNRTLKRALFFLYSLKQDLGLPDSVIESAAYIYRKATLKKITVGRNAIGLMCAAIYIACRQSSAPRSIVDVAHVSNISKKELSRSCRILIKKLGLNLDPYDPAEFIAKIANEVKISEQTSRGAVKILQKLNKRELFNGKNPMVTATAVLYLSCVLNGERRTQSLLARTAGITTVALRIRYCYLRKELDL